MIYSCIHSLWSVFRRVMMSSTRDKGRLRSFAMRRDFANHERLECLKRTGVKVGEDTFLNHDVTIVDDPEAGGYLEIGKRVSIAPGVIFVCDSNPNSSRLGEVPYVKKKLIKSEPIFVGDDCWIGAGAIILPGIRLGSNSIIGAGSVVSKDVPPYAVVAGVPARIIRRLDEKT